VIAVLCGGVGGSRFLRGLAAVLPPEEITAVVNTADDEVFHGLHVSPDLDIVTYALAGVVDDERGWGFRDETFRWLESLGRFGRETWFRIGDHDLATHLHRTRLLREGRSLSEVAAGIARAFGVDVRLLPMSDDRVRTVVDTEAGPLPFQEFLVKRHARDAVRGVRFEGAEAARPAPGVLDAIAGADAVLVAPSNPIASIGPILSVPGIRDAVASSSAPKAAVSPIIDGRSLQPPAGEMMEGLGYRVDVIGVAEIYAGLLDTLFIDEADSRYAAAVRAAGLTPVVTRTLMPDADARRDLATAVLRHLGVAT
jgi:LPPG:FO 2-phospho-L-lactate transferase